MADLHARRRSGRLVAPRPHAVLPRRRIGAGGRDHARRHIAAEHAGALFEDVYESKGNTHIGYDVAPDGKFLFVRNNSGAPTEKYLSLVDNFLPELRRRTNK